MGRAGVVWVCAGILGAAPMVCGQQNAAANAGAANTATAAAPHRRISLDVVVTDAAGKLKGDLEPTDFSVLDNDAPRKIMGFRRTNGVTGSHVDPPTEMILLVDVVDMPYDMITFQRLQIDKFLRSNGGHLSQPTSLFVMGSAGLSIQPQPSTDGNAIADALDKVGGVRAMGSASGYAGLLEEFDRATRTLLGIADNEINRPGRKILIWVGHGWPLLQGPVWRQSNESRQTAYKNIVNIDNKLREARMSVYGLFTMVGENGGAIWEGHLKPVTDPRRADPADLALQVIAVHSGGRVLDPTNDVAGQIASCYADAGPYYTLLVDEPPPTEPGGHHVLTVKMQQPGLAVRTNSGYYDVP